MIRKIKKYLKFAVCLTLIFGLMAPSYAALSASDGSAFITKAEFDSALADFNSRLTTFEAGINSKIDSQVTSYLDRNGIWNGKEQTFLNFGLINDLYSNFEWYNADDEHLYKWWFSPEMKTNTDWSEGINVNIKAVEGREVWPDANLVQLAVPAPGSYVTTTKIIDQCDKTGLMFLNWLGRDSARLNFPYTQYDTSSRRGTWLYDLRYNNGSLSSFNNQSKYNSCKLAWVQALSVIAARGTGTNSLNGWGACVAPAMTNAWSSFSLSQTVRFHAGYDADLSGIDALSDTRAEQLVWNYTLQNSSPNIAAYDSYPNYAQYRIGIQGDANQYTNLFFVNKGDPVYVSIIFTISGRTPQDAVRFISACSGTAVHGHLAGTAFMLSSYIY